MRGVPPWVAVLEAESQEGAGNPCETRREGSQGRGQGVQTGEGNQPHGAGEDQDEDTVSELQSRDQGQQTNAAQDEEQPAHHLHLPIVPPLQELHDQEIPEEAGRRQRRQPASATFLLLPPQVKRQEEKRAADTEQGTDGLRKAQQSPQIQKAKSTLQAPGIKQRGDKDRKCAEIQSRSPQSGAQQIRIAKSAQVK